jgi:methionyl-tRNA formyltransferase
VIDFGTSKVGEHIINMVRGCIVNLHGGDPEKYRGLDSHIWAMYHGDFDSLVTTLHHLSPELDKGAIIARKSVEVSRGMKFHEFRRANTETCIQLTLDMLKTLSETGNIISIPQKSEGRYYSFMPTVLKNIAMRKFEKYADDL